MNATDKKIGVFDSGHGGLSLVRALLETRAPIQVDYFADLEFHPYGALNDETVLERAILISQKLIERGAELILVACNTATAVAIDSLREKFQVPFVGVEPYLTLFERQTIPTEDAYVLMTPLMANSERFKKLKQRRDPSGSIREYTFFKLASLVEEGFELGQGHDLQSRIQQELNELKQMRPKSLILGCTHYPFIKDMIEHWTGASCYGPCPFVAKRVLHLLELDPFDSGQVKMNGSFSYSRELRQDFRPKDISAYPIFRIL